MRIEYFIELDDLMQFNRFHMKNSKVMRRVYLCLYFIPIIIAFLDDMSKPYYHWSTRVIGFLLFSALWLANCFFWKWFFSSIVMKRILKEGRNRSVLGRHEIVLEESKLIERTSLNEMHNDWSGIERVLENDRYIFIYVSGSQAHPIPKRAFATQDEARTFFETAKAYHGRAQGLPQYCGAPASVVSS